MVRMTKNSRRVYQVGLLIQCLDARSIHVSGDLHFLLLQLRAETRCVVTCKRPKYSDLGDEQSCETIRADSSAGSQIEPSGPWRGGETRQVSARAGLWPTAAKTCLG